MRETRIQIAYRKTSQCRFHFVRRILPTKDALYFLLCDGLGGHGSGDIASSFVVEQMKANLEKGISVEKSRKKKMRRTK